MKRIRPPEPRAITKQEAQRKAVKMARETKDGEVAFVKGGVKPAGSGRVKGQTNKHSRILKEMVFDAMALVGEDGRGKGGGVGYLANVAKKHPDLYIQLLLKIIPYSLSGAGGGPVQVSYTNIEEITLRLKERGLPAPDNLLAPPRRQKPVEEDAEIVDAEFEPVED